MSSARDEVLARIHRSLGPAPAIPDVPRGYRTAGTAGAGDALERFLERVVDYGVGVHRTLEAAIAVRGVARLAVAPGLDARLDGVELLRDDPPLPILELDALDGVLTGCALAIAETGTIVLDGSPACGRRALTLVPDYHVCIVRSDQIVATVPDAVAWLGPAAREGRPLTFISGPSATSDIELERVEGVHGPRTLDVVVAPGASATVSFTRSPRWSADRTAES
jgi:L-lactate dehydrogenase complex protein LldG